MFLPPRLRTKVRRDRHGCWLWQGSISAGYAQVRWNGRPVKAHRVVWELLRGPIPEGMEVDHLCRVTHCLNPRHLEIVTPAENRRRANQRRTYIKKTHCPRGHPYDKRNTYISKRNGQVCRRCRADDALRRYHAS